jgi:hypothetical protein
MTRLLALLAAVWPLSVSVPASHRRACRLLDLTESPETVLAASYTATLLGLAVGGVLLVGSHSVVVVVAAFGFAALALTAGRYGVELAARARRVRALGTAPSLVTRLVLGVGLWPNTERAAVFATETGSGLLVERLGEHRQRAGGTPRSGVRAFAEEWGETFPALERAIAGVERAAAAPADERDALLADARQRMLDGTRDEMASFAASLRIPATAIYAFGVLLPLALVSLVPAAGMAGVPVSESFLLVAYVLVLPATLVLAAAWLLAQRPAAFPPLSVPRTHPDVPDSHWGAVLSGSVAVVACGGIGPTLLPDWGVPGAALGFGTGTALVVAFRPMAAVRDHVRTVEAGLPDLLQAIGRRVARGEAVEAALATVADERSTALSETVTEAAARQRSLGVGIEEAFAGECGPLATLPSRRVGEAASLLSAAGTIGPPAGAVVASMGDHLADLREIERETRRDLAQITGTLTNTAVLFGPLVGGATVALAGSIGPRGPVSSVPVDTLGPIVCWYVLVLAAVLTALSVGLSRGLDRALVGYRVGLSLLSATAAYFASVLGTGLLV